LFTLYVGVTEGLDVGKHVGAPATNVGHNEGLEEGFTVGLEVGKEVGNPAL